MLTAAPEPYRTLLAVAVYGGLRQSEILGLRWLDVDLGDRCRLHVRGQLDRRGQIVPLTKTRKGVRSVPLSASVAQALREHRLASPFTADTDFVFVTANGTPMHQRNVLRKFNSIIKAAEIAKMPKLRFHDLRHTAASLFIAQKPKDVFYVSRVMGHSSTQITYDLYGHWFEQDERDDELREGVEKYAAVALAGNSRVTNGTEGRASGDSAIEAEVVELRTPKSGRGRAGG